MSSDTAVYLNTDLDLVAPFDLQPLADALVARDLMLLTLHARGTGTFAVLEMASSGLDETLEDTVQALLSAVESLDHEARQWWDSCTSRDFNIGYQCGLQPVTFEHGLGQETIARMAAAKASLSITLYPFLQTEYKEGDPNAKSL